MAKKAKLDKTWVGSLRTTFEQTVTVRAPTKKEALRRLKAMELEHVELHDYETVEEYGHKIDRKDYRGWKRK